MKKLLSLSIAAFLVPSFAFAVTNIFGAEALVLSLLGKLGYLFWMLSIVAFFYGLVKFITNSTEPEEREKGKSVMVWGLIAFTVLFSMWALVRWILVDTLLITAAPVDFRDKNGVIVAP